MRTIGISTRVFLAFACVVVVFAGVLVYGALGMHHVQEDARLIHHSYVPLSLVLSEAHTDLATYDAALGERDKTVLRRVVQAQKVIYPFPRRITANLARGQEFVETGLELVEGTTSDDAFLRDARGSLRRLMSSLLAFEQDTEAYRQAVLDERWQDVFALQSSLRLATTSMQRDLAQLKRAVRVEIGEAIGRSDSSEREALAGLIVLTIVASLIALAIMLLTHRTLRPIKELTEAARELAQGDYSGRVRVQSRDEVGKLADEFNRMASKIDAREQALRQRRDELEVAYARLVELREQEERTKAELIKKERLAAIGRMTSKVTHELRNPLSSLGLTVEMLSEELDTLRAPVDSEARELLASVMAEIDRLTEITEEYLAFARLPVSKPSLTDLEGMVRDLLRFVREELAQRGVSLELDLRAQAPHVLADSNQLRRAMLNLVRNALEAMQQGGQLSVASWREEDDVVLAVSDSGPGIPTEELGRIFEPFYSTKESGTGLGLSLTHQIIEEHGGRILVSSTPGEGASFRIMLPLAPSSESTEQLAAGPPSGAVEDG